MPIRKNLLAWQMRGYANNHQDRLNIIIHVVTVPLAWASLSVVLFALAGSYWNFLPWGGFLFLIPLIGQGIGHKRENVRPEPFLGPADFVSRFLAEQFITFPNWILKKNR